MAAYQQPPPPSGGPQPQTPQRSYTCPWCGTVSQGVTLSCPACGAPVDVKLIVSKSGWYESPGIRDMAKLQFGSSHCQIEGTYVPVADMNLATSDSVYFTHHVLLWKDPSVAISTMPLKGGWKRMFAGLPLIMTQAHGPGHIAFSQDKPGEMVALPLQPGQAIDVREHAFMVATSAVQYDWFQTGIYFTTKSGDDTETHYPMGTFMDRFLAPQAPGLLLLHGGGNVFVRRLGQGETILIKPTSLLYKDTSVQMNLHMERSSGYQGGFWGGWSSWNHRHIWLRLFGPGRVAIESAFAPMEDNGSNITSSSPLSTQNW
ncbi:MAG: AIM24 family protein [Chloroflexia bacterium]